MKKLISIIPQVGDGRHSDKTNEDKENKMMKKALLLSATLLAMNGIADITYPSGLTGAWEFDNAGDLLHADTGNDLTLTGSHSAVAGADGGAVEIGVGSYYSADHGMAGNGGSTDWVNDYTILMDIKVPASGWHSLFQTDFQNSNDGEAFVAPNETVGVGATGYSSTALNLDQWYRLAISVSLGDHYSIYIDGTSILEGGALAVNGTYAIFSASNATGNEVLFFADNDGEDNLITVDRLAIFDRDLSAGEIAAMGAVPEPATLSLVALLGGGLLWVRKCFAI